jgi:hypothetical protein
MKLPLMCRVFGHRGIPCAWSAPISGVMLAGFVLACERCGTWLAAHPTADALSVKPDEDDDSTA